MRVSCDRASPPPQYKTRQVLSLQRRNRDHTPNRYEDLLHFTFFATLNLYGREESPFPPLNVQLPVTIQELFSNSLSIGN